MPRSTKVVVEPRAPVSSTGTFLNSLREEADDLVAVAVLLRRPRPRREVVPARAAGGLRVRRDHGDAGLGQVAPVLDALRIALAHQEHDRRGVRRAVVRQARLPVGRQQLALLGDRVDVGGERERDHVGLQAVDHRARLLAGAAVRGADLQRLAGLLFPLRGELRVDVGVELARRVVGDVEQFDVLRRGRTGQGQCEQRGFAARVFMGEPASGQKENCARVKKAFSSSRSAPFGAPPSNAVGV